MFDEDESREEREAEQRLAQRQRVDDVKWQMGTAHGRRFVWALLRKTKCESRDSLFDTHGGRQSYLIGAFEVGRAISEEIRRLCPEQYLLMVQENTTQPDEVTQ